MKETLSDQTFKLMHHIMRIMEWVHPNAEKRVKTFGIREGMTVVDYGCGPGRYTIPMAQIVGEQGRIIAVDLVKIAGEEIQRKAQKYGLCNIQFILAQGYDSKVDLGVADMVVALDMFFMVESPTEFLRELSRVSKKDGILVIDDGHQSRAKTKKKLAESGIWAIFEESKDHLKCKKVDP
ncbi:MAG TPA: methyltransferase domain-containing protein [Bacillota bacterium]|nr:methyltransferase domain-containing protein [Bacillota bacterium]